MSDRQRRYRERQRCGIRIEAFEVDNGRLREKLVGSGRMTEAEFDDHAERQRVLAALFEQFIELFL